MPSSPRSQLLRRRAILAALAAGSLGSLTGCGIRLERDAPRIPGIETQAPPADQAPLRRLAIQLDAAIDTAALNPAAWPTKLGTIHRAQRTRLTQVMATQGMTPPARTPQPTGPTVDPAGLFSVEQAGARQAGSWANISAPNLPMVAAITATESAGARMLGHGIEVGGGTVPKTPVVQAILPSLRAATYALEVVVAKTPVKQRPKGEPTLTFLHATRATWEASLGKDLPAPPDGYALPVQPTTDAGRHQLAQQLLGDLIDSCAANILATRGDTGSFIGLVNTWADATASLWSWGAPPTPFPGLKAV